MSSQDHREVWGERGWWRSSSPTSFSKQGQLDSSGWSEPCPGGFWTLVRQKSQDLNRQTSRQCFLVLLFLSGSNCDMPLKKIHTTVCDATNCSSNQFLICICSSWKHPCWRSVPALNSQGHSPLCHGLDLAFPIQHSHSTLYFQDLLSFFTQPHFRTQPPVLQGCSPALQPSAWGAWQAAHWGHGLGRNFLFPPAFQPEITVKLMGYLSSKFSNKVSQLVRIIQPQLALVWSQGLPQMSLPGLVQKLQSL